MYGATIGKLGILTFPATTNQACCACIEYFAITQHYLFYFLLSHRDKFIAKGGGGAQPNISKEIIVNTEIPLPPLSEQERIVTEIERWFTLIDQIEQDKTDLEIVIKQAKNKILDLAIHGKLVPQAPNDEPAVELLKRINPDFTSCDNGHYRGEREFKILKSGKYVAANSLLILVDGENSGEVFRTPIEGYQGSTFKQLHINENMHADYLLHVINLHRKALRENKVGSAIPHLNKKLFKAIEVPVPPYNEQVRIVAAINLALCRLDAIMENL